MKFNLIIKEDRSLDCEVLIFNEEPYVYDFKYKDLFFKINFKNPLGGEKYVFFKDSHDWVNYKVVMKWEKEFKQWKK